MNELSRDEFIETTGGADPDRSLPVADGQFHTWSIDGQEYTEWHPDLGGCRWWTGGITDDPSQTKESNDDR